MPAPREIIEAAAASVAAYCEQRSTDDYRIEHAVRGSSITIVERRPQWNPDFGTGVVELEGRAAALRRESGPVAAALGR